MLSLTLYSRLKLQKTTCHLQQHFFNIFEPNKGTRDLKIIVWIEYFPYRASHIRFISEFILYATKNTNYADHLIPFIM
jgi:hypothetical protein